MKRLLAFLLVLVLALSLFACGSNENKKETNNESSSILSSSANITEEKAETATKTETESIYIYIDPFEVSPNSLEDLENIIDEDITNTVANLYSEWDSLSSIISTYNDYLKNADAIELFYNYINSQIEQVCIRLQIYTVKYAEIILSSDVSNDDKYDAFDDLKDCIYDDMADNVKDDIYDDLLKDMQDLLYDDILDDSDSADSYSDWYDVRSDEYENWYDTRSDVYENWYDSRSDIYSFIYDIRSELWNDDTEEAEKILANYKTDVEKLVQRSPNSTNNYFESIEETAATEPKESTSTIPEQVTEPVEVTTKVEETITETIDSIRPDFKAAMDSYESYIKEYCDFMKNFDSNSTDLSYLSKYSALLQELQEMSEAFEAWKSENLNDAELKYYLAVTNRVNQMLLEVQ